MNRIFTPARIAALLSLTVLSVFAVFLFCNCASGTHEPVYASLAVVHKDTTKSDAEREVIPQVPVLKSPANDYVFFDPSLVLQWSCAGKYVSFEIQISTGNAFVDYDKYETADTMISVKLGKEYGQAFWRVQSVNAKRKRSEWSAVGTFSIVRKAKVIQTSGCNHNCGSCPHPCGRRRPYDNFPDKR
ncbi:MAG: hypothetical protein KKA07_15720 [Bacteroidetes bacterium]|nr:hypothetical protein [Bacteroidota bacterium]MBU1720512.1 hypothetical protein [Bacteroidota bacterium]